MKPMDRIDFSILRLIQDDCRVPLDKLADRLGIPKSTLHYRIKRLEEVGVIEGYHARVNPLTLGKDYVAIILLKAKYGPRYHQRVGKKIASVPGVWAVYYVFGEYDFIVMIRSADREEYMKNLETLINMPDVERTNTQIVGKIIKEDVRVTI
jgi:Lrp/AsnC family leucine-responsive transcriptional regulator